VTDKRFRVGEVARRSGLTVRTLHHYDAIGLLKPSLHSAAGHRLYGVRDLERLELILLYRQMGLSLDDIRAALEVRGDDLGGLLRRQLQRIDVRVREYRQQQRFLENIVARLDSGDVLTAGELLQTIEVTAMFEKHYPREQLDRLNERRNGISQDEIERVGQEWQALFASLEEAREAGVPADSPLHAERISKAQVLIAAFTGGDADIAASLGHMVQAEPDEMFRQWGISQALGEYWFAVIAAQGG
jgi:DNA-binding transcriptional MerR regulator